MVCFASRVCCTLRIFCCPVCRGQEAVSLTPVKRSSCGVMYCRGTTCRDGAPPSGILASVPEVNTTLRIKVLFAAEVQSAGKLQHQLSSHRLERRTSPGGTSSLPFHKLVIGQDVSLSTTANGCSSRNKDSVSTACSRGQERQKNARSRGESGSDFLIANPPYLLFRSIIKQNRRFFFRKSVYTSTWKQLSSWPALSTHSTTRKWIYVDIDICIARTW